MPSMKIIKRRIASVKSTKQIMKAMNLVAASKLQKAKGHLNSTRPLLNETMSIMESLRHLEDVPENAFIKARDVKSTAYVVVSSDKGLCGGYNSNVTKAALAEMDKKNEKIIAVGAKGAYNLRRKNKNVLHKLTGVSDATFYEDAKNIGKIITDLYLSGDIDEVYVIYTHFGSMISHQPRVEKILPLEQGAADGEQKNVRMGHDPDIDAFLEHAVPMYINIFLYSALVESSVCEHAARMMSMDAAANNAGEIIEDLTLVFNRKRQNIITQEINEIVSGANALK